LGAAFQSGPEVLQLPNSLSDSNEPHRNTLCPRAGDTEQKKQSVWKLCNNLPSVANPKQILLCAFDLSAHLVVICNNETVFINFYLTLIASAA